MAVNYNKFTAYRLDERGRVIHSAVSIVEIQEVSIVDSAFTLITIPNDVACKSLLVKIRGGGTWLLSLDIGGSTYLTVSFNHLSLDIAGAPGEALFYAKSASGSKTLEIMYID